MGGVSRRAFVGGALSLPLVARAGDGWAVKNARILVGDGSEIEGGVRVEGGRVVAVGPGVTDGEDMDGAVLFPGFYEAGTTLGLLEVDLEGASHDQVEGSDAVVPHARVVDGYNPRSALLPVARAHGVMGALVMPAGGLVGGQAAWLRTAGDTVGDAVLAAPAGVCIRLGHHGTGSEPNAPRSRMGVAMKLRDLLDAHEPPEEPKRPKRGEEPKITRMQRALHALRRRETKAILCADRADDILTGLDLAAEYALDAVLLGAAEGHLVAGRIAAAAVPVLLGPVTVQPSGWDTLHATYENAARLHAAGVRIALRNGNPHQARDLPTEACVAVAHGLPREAAVAAVSGNGPGFWGLDVGRIAPGCEATFVRADGDPLQPRTRLLGAWMRGRPLSLRSRQTDLYERFRTLR